MYSDFIQTLRDDNLYDGYIVSISSLHNSYCSNCTVQVLNFIDGRREISRITGNPERNTVDALWFSPIVKLYFIQVSSYIDVQQKIHGTLEALYDWTTHKLGQIFTIFYSSRVRERIETIILVSTYREWLYARNANQHIINTTPNNPILGQVRLLLCDDFDTMVQNQIALHP